MNDNEKKVKKLTTSTGNPVAENQNSITPGSRIIREFSTILLT